MYVLYGCCREVAGSCTQACILSVTWSCIFSYNFTALRTRVMSEDSVVSWTTEKSLNSHGQITHRFRSMHLQKVMKEIRFHQQKWLRKHFSCRSIFLQLKETHFFTSFGFNWICMAGEPFCPSAPAQNELLWNSFRKNITFVGKKIQSYMICWHQF